MFQRGHLTATGYIQASVFRSARPERMRRAHLVLTRKVGPHTVVVVAVAGVEVEYEDEVASLDHDQLVALILHDAIQLD